MWSLVQVSPVEGVVVVTDFLFTNWYPRDFESVMSLGHDSRALAAALPAIPKGRLLDLCAGSGVQAIVAAARGGVTDVTLVDINPRARRFARFNMLINRSTTPYRSLWSTMSTGCNTKHSSVVVDSIVDEFGNGVECLDTGVDAGVDCGGASGCCRAILGIVGKVRENYIPSLPESLRFSHIWRAVWRIV